MAAKKQEFYVYFLIDPRNDEIFYIGKGRGRRLRDHVRDARNGRIGNVLKHRRIKAILDEGQEVVERIHKDGIEESEAFRIERELIRAHRDNGCLTNIAGGSRSNEDVAAAVAKHYLSQMRPFSTWSIVISTGKREAIERECGSLRAFYDDSLAFLQRMARTQA